MIDEREYEDIDFSPSSKPIHRLPSPVSQPIAPPRTTSRYVDRHLPVSGGVKPPPVPASKPRRPLPPPKPHSPDGVTSSSHEPIQQSLSIDAPAPPPRPQSASHELKRQSLSMEVPAPPPKPQTMSPSHSFDTSHNPLMRRTNVVNSLSQLPGEQMTLSEFVKNHSKELPLRVRVDEGFCGNDERFIISTGDVYNLHFIKTVKVVSIQDFGGLHFSVPLNSSVKFGVLYNPENNFYKSLQGYTFQNVTAITSAKLHPKLILSTTECLCTDPKSSVEANELLVIKKVGKTALKRRPFIKVVNVKTKEEKTLYDECEGNFTTAPSAVQLYLPEILEHFKDFLPLQTMLYPTTEAQDNAEFPLDLTSDMVTLTHTSIETSIVATTYWGEDEAGLSDEDFIPIAIPIELEIEITILGDESEDLELYSNTKDLLKTFDPSKIKDMAEAKTDRAAQSHLYKNIRKGHELSGMEIEPPSRIYDVIGSSPVLSRKDNSTPTHPHAVPLPALHSNTAPLPASNPQIAPPLPSSRPPHSSSQETRHEPPKSPRKPSYKHPRSVKPVPEPPHQSTPSGIPAIQKPTGSVEEQISDLHSNTRALKCLLDALQDNSNKVSSDLKAELKRIGRIVENLSRNYERLERQVDELRQGQTSPTSLGTTSLEPTGATTNQGDDHHSEKPKCFKSRRTSSRKKTADPDLRVKNIEELASMDCNEVLTLLGALNLSQYQNEFEKEQVDGELLVECDEEVLRTELNMTSLIHRKKLMSVINGSQSPVGIIQSIECSSDYYI